MKTKFTLFFCSLLAALSSQSYAEHMPGATIAKFCVHERLSDNPTPDAEFAVAVCVFYVSGVLEGAVLARASFNLNELELPLESPQRSLMHAPECIPNAVSNVDLAFWVARWLQDRPERHSEPASLLVMEAINEGYCKNE